MDSSILSHKNGNNKITPLKARQFALAFIAPNKQLNTNVAQLWLNQVVEAKSALNSLHFAIQKWIENGEIDLSQFSEEFESLSLVGLEGFADDLLSAQLCAIYGAENGGER